MKNGFISSTNLDIRAANKDTSIQDVRQQARSGTPSEILDSSHGEEGARVRFERGVAELCPSHGQLLADAKRGSRKCQGAHERGGRQPLETNRKT